MLRKPMRVLLAFVSVIAILAMMAGMVSWSGVQAAPQAEPTPNPRQDGNLPIHPEGYDVLDDPRLYSIYMAEALAPAPTGGPDKFGYVWSSGWITDTAAEHHWDDASAGTAVAFSNPDTGVSPAIPIPFGFKFYENTYSQLYISPDGYITFPKTSMAIPRQLIPHPSEPNGMVLLFADDLAVGGDYNTGKVLYQTFGTEPNRRFVIQWNQVTKLGASDILTFQAALYENGKIAIRYKTLFGDLANATVGIEDPDGLDGLMYLHFASGLRNGRALLLTRPTAAPRVKLMASYLSSFMIDRTADILLQIRNTGESSSGGAYSDTYNLSTSQLQQSGSNAWSVLYLRENGSTPLTDSNSDGSIDTGPLAQGQTITVTVRIKGPADVSVGNYVKYSFTATSVNNTAKKASLTLQAAVPASFAQAFVDINRGIGLDLIWSRRRTTTTATDWFSGSTLALVPLGDGNFIYLWERNELREVVISTDPLIKVKYPYTDLEYSLINRVGELIRTRVKLTDNKVVSNPRWIVMDRYPAAAPLNDGRIGVTWVRDISDDTSGQPQNNSNVHFAIINPEGDATEPIILTNNSQWSPDDQAWLFQSLSIADINDTSFLVSWADTRNQAGVWMSDIYYGVYDKNGSQVKAPTKITSSTFGGDLNHNPVLTSLSGGRTMITYSIEHPDMTTDMAFVVLNAAGSITAPETFLSGAHGLNADATQLSTGEILIAWSDTTTSEVNFVLLNGDSYAVLKTPTKLANPDGRTGGYVSVTYSTAGNGVLTWMDDQWDNYLYYALIDHTGQVLTPPMIFYPVNQKSTYVISSDITQGNAPYFGGYRILMPLFRMGR